MRKFIYITFFYSSFFLSQISVNIQVIKKSSNTDKTKFLEIKIKNNSNVNYALPLDTLDFKPFYEGESCVNFSSPESYNDLMLKTYFENEYDGESLMAIPKFKLLGKIDENNKNVIKEVKNRDSLLKLQDKELEVWVKKYKIKQGNNWALKNQFLYSNIILLNPNEEIKYYKNIDTSKLNLDKIGGNYDYYNLDPNTHYKFSLKYCINPKIYDFLTKKQKNKLKEYSFFSGNLESNILQW